MMYRLIVTGARNLPEPEIVWVPLWMVLHQKRAIIVTHGKCERGTDLYVRQWFDLPEQAFNRRRRRYESATDELLAIEDPMPADWSKGKIAGPIRNQQMIDKREPKPADAVFAFPTPDCSGTLDCMARAWVRGIPVWVWHYLVPGQWRPLDDREGEQLARRKLGWGR